MAIVRALIGYPMILLLDEPFSALDSVTRASLHTLLVALWAELQLTIVLLTHEVTEAVQLADRIAVLRPHPGRLQQVLPLSRACPRDRRSPGFGTARRPLLAAIDRSLADTAMTRPCNRPAWF